ncbi:MAG: mitochondrial import receptor protein [Chrysothrix sp. TS-e1954]|nr:MAG: mitochondrial import receptor protein [Chrysothrix sp. TS-e1954]
MVKLEEVEDEAFTSTQGDEEGDWDTDSESEASDASDPADDETLFERISALKDVIPPNSRRSISASLSKTTEWGWWGVQGVAKIGWIVSASMIMLGIPYAIAMSEDQQIAMQEKEMQMQQSANEVIAPGATSQQSGQQSR